MHSMHERRKSASSAPVIWYIVSFGQFRTDRPLSQIYLTMCNALAKYCLEIGHYEHATSWIIAILKENRCDERAHWQLMRVYATQGRRSDALRQYHLCERILAEELGARPMPEMLSLYQAILNNENLPGDGMKIEPK